MRLLQFSLVLTLVIISFEMHGQLNNSQLFEKIKELENQEHLISADRKVQLADLALDIRALFQEQRKAEITFVCTHNSRRSQLAELWLRMAAHYYKINNLQSYSGGTESTAFNYRMVDALKTFGFMLEKGDEKQNPSYFAHLEKSTEPIRMFSKKYDDPFNPQADFIAVMVCSQADKDCPFVPGAYARYALPYEDPKHSDDTPLEKEAYLAKVKEIGREILFMTKKISEH